MIYKNEATQGAQIVFGSRFIGVFVCVYTKIAIIIMKVLDKKR